METARRVTDGRNVELINQLIKQSFGKNFRGNYSPGHGGPWGSVDSLSEVGELYLIANRGFLSFGETLGFGARVVGQFTNSDGSNLKVLPRFGRKAIKYASLYKEVLVDKPQ